MPDGASVQIRDLERRFGALEAVRGIRCEIREGETFGLLGPNGAGKTTTLSMLSTLLPPSGGDATLFGHSLLREPRVVRRLIGLAPQQISLYPDLSGEENLRFFGHLYGLGSARLGRRVDELLALVGLEARRADRVASYSGGMQRRLNLACALVHEPRLLLLDEPTAGVDPQSRDNLFRTVEGLAAAGTTVLYTTHYMEEAQRLCDRIAILDDGRIIAQGTLRELLGIVGMGEVIELRAATPLPEEALRAIPGVLKLESANGVTRVSVRSAVRAMDEVAALCRAAGSAVEGIEVYPVDLERVFMHLTGRGLRD